MAGYIARQVEIDCPYCGFFLWKKILLTDIIEDGKTLTTETDEGPICPGYTLKCQAADWLEFIRYVVKFEPLKIENPKVKLLPPGFHVR